MSQWEFLGTVDINGKEAYVDYNAQFKAFDISMDGYDYTASLQEVLEFWFRETYKLEEPANGQV